MGGHAIFALMSESSDPLAGAPLAEDHAKGRLFRFWIWQIEEWRLFVNVFQALGAVTVAGLALYGVFFTSIPELIVRPRTIRSSAG
jgi:hypothetical protein